MAQDRIDEIENQLATITHRLDLLDFRLRLIEQRGTGSQQVQAPPPPPVRPAPNPAPPPIIARAWQPTPQDVPQEAAPPTRPDRDTEYAIGAKLLPRLGAALVLGAVLYFVGWAYTAGWITLWMVFSGEIAFCLGFIAVGQWKRNEREQYGQILTGIGSCGLYASFAGGHLVQKLYAGEVLVAAFLVLSLANLAYGLWSKSKAFYCIGLLGGFAAALLPMREGNTNLNIALHFTVLAPAAIIAARRLWSEMAGLLWLVSTMAMSPLLLSELPWPVRIASFYGAALASIATYLYTVRESSFDSEALAAPLMLFASGLIGLAIRHEPSGAYHLLILAGSSGLIALIAGRYPLARERVLVSAVAIVAVLMPLCFDAQVCLSLYAGFSLLASVISIIARMKVAAIFSVAEFALAVVGYLVVQSFPTNLEPAHEAWLLVAFMAAGVSSAYASVRSGGAAQPFAMGAMAVILPLFTRFGVITLPGTSVSHSPEFAAAEALACYVLVAIFVTARTQWVSAMVSMWTAFTIAVLAYIYAVSFTPVPSLEDAGLVCMFGLTVTIGLPFALSASPADFKKPISGCAFVIVGVALMRLAFVLSSMPGSHVLPAFAVCLTAAGYSLIASATAVVRKNDVACVVGWSMFAAAGIAYLNAIGGFTSGSEAAIVTAALAAFSIAIAATNPYAKRAPEIWHAVSLVGWVLLSRWFFVALEFYGFDVHGASSLTISWIVYAFVLLTLGFALRARELRYWSFAVMFATVSKIVLIDLANTNTPFRVCVLLGLGLIMLGGGYWYIKGRHTPAAT